MFPEQHTLHWEKMFLGRWPAQEKFRDGQHKKIKLTLKSALQSRGEKQIRMTMTFNIGSIIGKILNF